MDRENKKIIQSFFDNFEMSGGGSIGGKKRVGDDITEQQNLIYGKLGSEIDLPENPLLLKQIGAILSGHAVEDNIEFPDRIKKFGEKDRDYNTSKLSMKKLFAEGGNDKFNYSLQGGVKLPSPFRNFEGFEPDVDDYNASARITIPLGALSNLGRMFKN
jgi:hypothetical protein